MTAGAASRQARALPSGLDEVLDQLTLAHAESFDRHGPIIGVDAPPPVDAVAFREQERQLAAAIDDASSPAAKLEAVQRHEAAEHDQIGRLAAYLAGYEAAHGDPGNVDDMKELSRAHFELAEQHRETAASMAETVALEDIERRGGVPEAQPQPAATLDGSALDDLMPRDIIERVRAERANQNDRGSPGRSL